MIKKVAQTLCSDTGTIIQQRHQCVVGLKQAQLVKLPVYNTHAALGVSLHRR